MSKRPSTGQQSYSSKASLQGQEAAPLADESKASRWSPLDEPVNIAGRSILAMIYVGAEPPAIEPDDDYILHTGFASTVAPWIDPSLPVSKPSTEGFGDIHCYYSRNYARMGKDRRGSYLDWLAQGATEWAGGNTSFFLNYFYGLEYRFFADSTDDAERKLIIFEVERLVNDCEHHAHCATPMGGFLLRAYAVVHRFGDRSPIHHAGILSPLTNQFGVLKLSVMCGLGRRAANGQALDADWLLAWIAAYNEHLLNAYCWEYFPEKSVALFRVLFDAKYPDGIRSGKRNKRGKYEFIYPAASKLFVCRVWVMLGNMPCTGNSRKLRDAALALLEAVCKVMDPYRTFIASHRHLTESLEAHLLLPKPLRPLYPCEAFAGMTRWLKTIADKGLDPGVTMEELATRVLGQHARYATKEELASLSAALQQFGLGMVPDPAFALGTIRLHELVIVFRLVQERRRVSTFKVRYKRALVALHAAMYVATRAEPMTPVAWDAINAFIRKITPGPGERKRLQSDAVWLTRFRPTQMALHAALRSGVDYTKRRAREAVSSLAAATGISSREHFQALVTIYNCLGLDRNDVRQDLVTLVASKRNGQGSPGAAPRKVDVRLNAGRVAMVKRDTSQVRKMLEPILADNDVIEGPPEGPPSVVKLDAVHLAFLEAFLTRRRWDAADAERLARQHRLMLGGAIEMINEWSDARFDDLLIEENDALEVNPAVAHQLHGEVKLG